MTPFSEPIDRLLASCAANAAACDVASFDFQHMVEQADIGICITQDGVFQYVNTKFAEMHDLPAAAMLGLHYTAVVHPDEHAHVAEMRRLRNAGQHHAAYESCHMRRDGSAFAVRVYGRAIVYRGQPANLVTMSDISELVDANRVAAWRARMLLSTELLCHSGSIEIGVAKRRVVLSAGARALILGDDGQSEISLAAALRCLPAEDRRAVLARWRHATPGVPFEFHHRLQRADGSLLRVLHRGLIEAGVGGAARPVAILQDVTEHTAAQAQIDRLQNYHLVTGLATRALLLRRSAAAIDNARQNQHVLALLYLRVPELDRIYGAFGVHAGDALAAVLAQRVAGICRAEDSASYIGRGEFALLLDAGVDEASALQIAERVLAALQAPVRLEDTELRIAGRVGVALFPGDAGDGALLLQHAREACAGIDNGISFFTREVGEKAARRIKLEAGLRRALERHELQLHYQPQVDLRSGSVAGVEALLRWTSDEFGSVSPAEFVPIAEEAGLIVAIGEWVFRSACQQSVAWARAGLPTVRIGINLSPRQLEQPDISRRLQSIVLETGADPNHLGIEVTESVLMSDLEGARRTLTELSSIGIEIALDDFGTGYSNINVLRALPFDVLKIDRSLVHDVTAAAQDVSITRAVLMLARGLKIKVLAEGVETQGQLDLLISNGCDLMQGYVFSKPLPAPALAALLREGRCLPQQRVAHPPRRRTYAELALAIERQEHLLDRQREQLSLEACRALNAQEMLENLPLAAIGLDDEGTIVFVNRQARRLMATLPMAVGNAAAEVLPADWQGAWDSSGRGAQRVRIGGRRYQLSCAPMGAAARGHLLSLVPDLEAAAGAAA